MASGQAVGGLAGDAMKYNGTGYVFGGAPATGIGHWDCSSFINWCVGHDLGMAIPGYKPGQYTGQTHGPVVIDWATWSGAQTVKGPPQQSDLCVWPGVGALGHIGIALSGDQMISAYDTAKGTLVTPIAGYGPPGVPVMYRRITGAASGGSLSSLGSGAGCVPLIYYVWLMHNALRERKEFGRYVARRQFRDRRREDEKRHQKRGQ